MAAVTLALSYCGAKEKEGGNHLLYTEQLNYIIHCHQRPGSHFEAFRK